MKNEKVMQSLGDSTSLRDKSASPAREGAHPAEPEVPILGYSKKTGAILSFHLREARIVEGRVIRFGHFTVDIQTEQGQQLLYKHAILHVGHPEIPGKGHRLSSAPESIADGNPGSMRVLVKHVLSLKVSDSEKLRHIEKLIEEKERLIEANKHNERQPQEVIA